MIPLYVEKVNCNGICVLLKTMERLIRRCTIKLPNRFATNKNIWLPKKHKIQSPDLVPPFRTVVSSLNTYNYQLAKFLSSLLQPHLPNIYTISDSFSFVQELNKIDASNKFMVSFDVVSLFTNIPLKERIDLAIFYITDGNKELKLSKAELTQFFTIATAQTHFLLNGKVYDQIDGVAMGSPIAPVLANLFLGHYENLWLNKYKGLLSIFTVDMSMILFVS